MELTDDTPPPLSCFQDQIHAAQLASSIIGTAGLQQGGLRVAAVTDSQGKEELTQAPPKQDTAAAANAVSKQPFKRGFLDGKASKRAVCNKGHGQSDQQDIIAIKPKQAQQPGSKPIPDCLRVPLDAQQQLTGSLRSQLLSALQPTPDTMSAVTQDPTLLAGFDDPEVMAAVSEVAQDPKSFAKHAHKPKVQQFYKAMGALVGSKLEKMAVKTQ